jgi:DnaJ family protein C protein 19
VSTERGLRMFRQTTPFIAGLGVAATALGARGLLHAYQAWRMMPPAIRQFYQGGFEANMSRREAALILGLRCDLGAPSLLVS